MSDQTQPPQWLVMVYISADNVLANFAIESLKQLKRSARKEVIVAAQMDVNEQTGTRRYLFDGTGDKNGSIDLDLMKITGPTPSPRGIADPENLTNFINDTLHSPLCGAAKHRCLFLWGHGYELLLDENQLGRAGSDGRDYLTPKNLKQALDAVAVEVSSEHARNPSALTKGEIVPFDIVGIDACAMSLIELATELKSRATYLIASQNDVPDASFPYEELLGKLKGHNVDDVTGICEAIPILYTQAYQDYIVAPGNGISEITLSSLRLDAVATVTEPLTHLAAALNRSAFDAQIGPKILKARQASQDFALGMFVDLYDFCVELGATIGDSEIKAWCDEICAAISSAQPKALVLKNADGKNGESRCHGVSIYFPCLAEEEIDSGQNSVSTQPVPAVDNFAELVKGGTNHLIKARGVRIGEMETDFAALTEFQRTGWIKFIQQGWSYILAKQQPNDLDRRYSAQQCAMNLAKIVQRPGQSQTLYTPPSGISAGQRNDKNDRSIPAHA